MAHYSNHAVHRMDARPAPQLTPRIHYASAIRADPALAASLTAFVNEGYRYFTPANEERWDRNLSDRLSSADSILRALGDEGLFAVAYDPEFDKPVACAATKRWEADLEGFAEEGESGWEIKIVTTHIDWKKRGLAGSCVDALIDELARRESSMRNGETAASYGPLNIWIQAVECLNGAFWMKRGPRLMRSYSKPIGHWGSKYGYRLLVMLQEIDVDERLSTMCNIGT
ncbi:hypothetical protein C7974DRAFT_405837 [Boeremia exigua]|uniref:uncharacterized protein n=1 Tax=Boeremia exigua TaxID=749465 RepID=UPI001E8DD5EC|nr:uncharacterized protein C7974DRAFT_405837 [Boeremia exigua]KAH6612565.1 hypothetical protein C7974DRAFT_405837 [Boeremia exigua]